MIENDDKYLMKICCIGSVSDLKTEFIRRFAMDKYDVNYLPTLGVDVTTKKIDIDNEQVKLILVDTAGHEVFSKKRPSYYRGASAFIIFFDKGDQQSFKAILQWKKEFHEHVLDPTPHAIVGFQAETEEVSTEEAKRLVEQLKSTYFECNPTHGQELLKILQFLGRKVIAG
ncbi:hypothetical protein CEE45_16840 [Candidatus Heimdallarchaeota archaeon B3_Heim]|nr:MAG: hypothetical protein CEE45_16840 [Candidatus Heimdallarchaeota archaeon B3_Heim]